MPDLIGYWLTGGHGGRGDERVDDRALRRRTPRLGRRTCSTSWACRAALLPPIADPGEVRRRGAPRGRARDRAARPTRGGARRLARHRLGGRRRPGRGRARSPTSRAGRGRSSASRSTAPILTEASRAANFTNEGGVDGRDPVPAQRHGAVAAPGVAARRGSAPASRRTCRRCSTAAAALPPGGPAVRRRRPGLPAAAATCRRGSRRLRGPAGLTPPSRAGRTRPVHPRQPRRGVRAGRRRRASGCPGESVEVVHIVGGGSQQRAAVPADGGCQRAAGRRRSGRGDGDRQRAGPGARARLVERRPRGAARARAGDERRCPRASSREPPSRCRPRDERRGTPREAVRRRLPRPSELRPYLRTGPIRLVAGRAPPGVGRDDLGPRDRSPAGHVPRAVFDYIDGAAETETSLRRSREAYARVEFVPERAAATCRRSTPRRRSSDARPPCRWSSPRRASPG